MDVDFPRAIERCLALIPPRRVATCGAVARALGDPRAARAVATWLAERPGTPGGHRVVRADGRPILRGASSRLTMEGVPIAGDRVGPDAIVDSLPRTGFLERLRQDQTRLAADVRGDERPRRARPFRRIAGVDVSYRADTMYAAAVTMDPSVLEPLEIAVVRRMVDFPYIPSYLAYREFPGIREAVDRLSEKPELVMVDGHGLLHPARFGIASHVGALLDVPTIGIAKHLLAGRVAPSSGRGQARPVRIDGEVRGYAWIPRGRSRAIYVSVGHRISLEDALRIARETTREGYPEPLRVADRISRIWNRREKREKGAGR